MPDLRCYARAFSVVVSRGSSAALALMPLTAAACCSAQALECGLSSRGTPSPLLRVMWNLPGPVIKPVSPALAGRFFSTVLPGKSPLSPITLSSTLAKLIYTIHFEMVSHAFLALQSTFPICLDSSQHSK